MKSKATEKQIKYILDLLSNIPPEDVVKLTYKYDLNNITKAEASELIKVLLEYKNKKEV